jgi:hypothetical protein
VRRLAGLALAAVLAAGCTTAPPVPHYSGDPSCTLGAEDRAWLEGAPAVWSLVQTDVFRLKPLPTKFTWVLFDGACAYTGAGDGAWTASGHNGHIKTADGEEHEPGVVSFVTPAPTGAFMLMSLPSIWRQAGVPDRGGMSPFLYSVFAHEMTHLRQAGPIYDRITRVATDAHFPEEQMGDDIVQKRFGDNAEFKASVKHERDVLLAGFSGDDAAARKAAGEALALIKARQAKFYTGENAALIELEDLFLTLEGMGQFAGYSYLVHPKGAARTSESAVAQMRTRWWSQEEGMAIMLVVSRLVPDWQARAFADKPATAFELLAVAAGGQ